MVRIAVLTCSAVAVLTGGGVTAAEWKFGRSKLIGAIRFACVIQPEQTEAESLPQDFSCRSTVAVCRSTTDSGSKVFPSRSRLADSGAPIDGVAIATTTRAAVTDRITGIIVCLGLTDYQPSSLGDDFDTRCSTTYPGPIERKILHKSREN